MAEPKRFLECSWPALECCGFSADLGFALETGCQDSRNVKIEPPILAALIILIWLAWTPPLLSTTIVMIRTPGRIVVAADSLWSYQKGEQELTPRIGCKVRRVGDIYFTGSSTNVDGLQMEHLALQAMLTSRSAAAAAERFVLAIGELAARTAALEKDSVIQRCWRRACAEAVFFGIEEGVPTIIEIRLEQVGESRESLKLKPHKFSCPGHCPARPRTVLLFGRKQYIDKVAQKTPELLQSDESTARKLVEIEKDAEPQYVGGPIDVLTLDAGGSHWSPVSGGTCSSDEVSSTK
jgi:hypothetical protein